MRKLEVEKSTLFYIDIFKNNATEKREVIIAYDLLTNTARENTL